MKGEHQLMDNPRQALFCGVVAACVVWGFAGPIVVNLGSWGPFVFLACLVVTYLAVDLLIETLLGD